MISGPQLRAARALLGWSQARLAEKSGVAEITIKVFERGVTDPRVSTMTAIIGTIEKAGVEFTNGGQPGVRMKAKAKPRGKAKSR